MAFINDLPIFVEEEELVEDVEGSSHPVETGIAPTDTIKRTAMELSISGTIAGYMTGYGFIAAGSIRSQLRQLKNSGAIVTYNADDGLISSMQIINFSSRRTPDAVGAYTFDMTLKEFRGVKNSYVEPVKDGGKQQVDTEKKDSGEEVWHTVKKGDCVAALVAEPKAPYKSLTRDGAKSGYWGACNWVMEKNPSAFSRKGDFRTLQIGKKILVGTKGTSGTPTKEGDSTLKTLKPA